VPRPDGWLQHVNEPQTEAEVKRLRECLRHGRPYGSLPWMTQTAGRLGLEATLRPVGRPKKITPQQTELFGTEDKD
jgi:putative transposase